MAIIHTPYAQSLKILSGAGDWLTDPVKLALLSSGYTFSAAHTMFDNGADNATDPSFSELAAGTGYTTGGIALATKTVADGAIDADPVVFPFTAEKTFRHGVVYIDATVDTIAKPLLFHILFDNTPADITIPSVDFAVNWNASGIALLTVAVG
jgi:hypothetical protein